MEVPDSHPFPFSSSTNGLAAENTKSEFEVSKGLLESAKGLLDFDIHSHFFLDVVS
jgi:hypothetical protein